MSSLVFLPAALCWWALKNNTNNSQYQTVYSSSNDNTHSIHAVGIGNGTVGILGDDEVVDLVDDAVHQCTGAGQRDQSHAGVQPEVDVDCWLLQQKVCKAGVTFQERNGQRSRLRNQTTRHHCHNSRVGHGNFSFFYYLQCFVLFFSRPRYEGWPHHGRTFSIYLCPLSF